MRGAFLDFASYLKNSLTQSTGWREFHEKRSSQTILIIHSLTVSTIAYLTPFCARISAGNLGLRIF